MIAVLHFSGWTACFASLSAQGSRKHCRCNEARSSSQLVVHNTFATRSTGDCFTRLAIQLLRSLCSSEVVPTCKLGRPTSQHLSFPHAAADSTPPADGLSCSSTLTPSCRRSARRPSTHDQHAADSLAACKAIAPAHTSCVCDACQQCHKASMLAALRGPNPCSFLSPMARRKSRRWVSAAHPFAALIYK
jgi:hypothetical protein